MTSMLWFSVTSSMSVPAAQELCVLRLQREANSVALAPDGRRAAVGLQVPWWSQVARPGVSNACRILLAYPLNLKRDLFTSPDTSICGSTQVLPTLTFKFPFPSASLRTILSKYGT